MHENHKHQIQESGYCGGRWWGEEGALVIEGLTEGFNSTGDFFFKLGGGYSDFHYIIFYIFLNV